MHSLCTSTWRYHHMMILGVICGSIIFKSNCLQNHQILEEILEFEVGRISVPKAVPKLRRVQNSISTDEGKRMDGEIDTQSVKPPLMHTFYEPDPKGYCCGMLEDGHQRLLQAWQDSWQDKGWVTVILTKKDAMKHPLFFTLQRKLELLQLSEYNQKCYWRWLAMASQYDDGVGGGWMSDYDTIPLELTAEKGIELAEMGKKFTSFDRHVPCLIHASRHEWERILLLMINVLPKRIDRNASDMMSLLKVREEYKEDSNMLWYDSAVVPTFPFKHNEENKVIVDCEQCRGKLAAHLSHKGTMKTFRSGLYPKAIDEEFGIINGRGEAAKIFLSEYRSQC